MASRAFIPIDDHNTPGVCSEYYDIRFKPGSVENWTQQTNVQPVFEGSPGQYGIVLTNLTEDIIYDYEITRHCCNQVNSVAASGTFDSTI